jgi:predicted GNAT family N-acyltransferase
MPYVFEPLDTSRHDRAAFSCGEPSLDNYLKTLANQDMRHDLAQCYVLIASGSSSIIGYYTLSSSAVDVSALPKALAKTAGRYSSVPAVLIGRLAVDTRVQGQHMGSHVLLDALRRCLRAGIGIKVVVVDALHEQAAQFYLHYGFRQFEDSPLRLYLPMTYVRSLFPADAPTEPPAADDAFSI